MAENFTRVSTALSTINATEVYSTPLDAKTSIVLSCLVANVDGTNNADITIQILKSDNTLSAHIAHQIVVPAESTLELIANKLILLPGDKLVATASAVNDLEVSVSVLELS